MLVSGDLGFLGPFLVFLIWPIVGFVIRRKWRIAVARREEITRLVVVAPGEAAEAELESTVECGTVSVARQFQCAVCYCHTATRCARCKVVRYCSGKCHIIHWRQGHKEECRPPSTTIQFDGEQIDSGREEMFQEQFEIYGNVFEIEGRCCTKPIETFPEELSESSHFPEVPWGKDDDKVEPLVDAEGTTTIYESSGTSSLGGFSASTNTSESSGDVSFCEVLSSSTPDISEGHPSDMLKNMADVNEMELTKSPLSECNSLGTSVNDFSYTNNLIQMTLSRGWRGSLQI